MSQEPLRRRGWDDKDDRVRRSYFNGYADRADEDERRHRVMAERLTRLCSSPPADILAERRGNPERAQRIRDFWALTGLHEPRPELFTSNPASRAALIARCYASWGLSREVEAA